jgi:hypothetical protein
MARRTGRFSPLARPLRLTDVTNFRVISVPRVRDGVGNALRHLIERERQIEHLAGFIFPFSTRSI